MTKYPKKKVQTQVYENYWLLNLAWSDFNGNKFLSALKICIDFIDANKECNYTSELYNNLQEKIGKALNLDLISVRKGINELVKLGFIYPFLRKYHYLAKQYIAAESDLERKLVFSKIVYSNSGFKRSVTKESDDREMNFVIKTIEHARCLDEKYLGVLIAVDISNYKEGYISLDDMDKLYRNETQVSFEKRKYNQIKYLKTLLNNLDGIIYIGTQFCLEKDTDKIQVGGVQTIETKGRDPYLQRIYKQQLQKESLNILGRVKCMVEKLEYPVLIASHIKPFRNSDDDEAFDPNNGLLLSKTLDSLFDLNYISFADDGSIIFYNRVPEDVKQFWKTYKLDERFINSERLGYLAYHRQLCNSKNNLLP